MHGTDSPVIHRGILPTEAGKRKAICAIEEYCRFSAQRFQRQMQERWNRCPVVFPPPHGRVINAKQPRQFGLAEAVGCTPLDQIVSGHANFFMERLAEAVAPRDRVSYSSRTSLFHLSSP
jgi:hypothetical protein